MFLATPTYAQGLPVVKWADWAGYGTAVVNPSIAVYQAFKSDSPKCRLGQLLISEAIGNGTALTVKHFVHSERPCFNCLADGMPSGHSMNGAIGAFSSGWGIAFALPTPFLRVAAHRHTRTQVVAGTLLGLAADWSGQHLLKCGASQ